MKYKYKKLLYLLGLTSMLTLNGCNKDNLSEVNMETTEMSDENICSHLDKENLNVKILSDGSKYIPEANLSYSIREKFLNNNRIIEFKDTDNIYFDNLANNNEYLTLFNNPVIQKAISGYINVMKTEYPVEILENRIYYEDIDRNSITIDIDAKNYNLFVNSSLTDFEIIQEKFINENAIFDKKLHTNKYETYRSISEEYILSSVETENLNRIKVSVCANYKLENELIAEENYNCSDFSGFLKLNSGVSEIEVEISEEAFYELTSVLANYAKEDKDVEQFLEENNELMEEMFGIEYEKIIEDAKEISYTLTKPAN